MADTRRLLFTFIYFTVVALTVYGYKGVGERNADIPRVNTTRNVTSSWCRGRGHFIYRIKNVLVEPRFTEQQMMCIISKRTTFINYMEIAVLKEPKQFTNFTATFSSPYGFFINSINGVTSNYAVNGTFWIFLGRDNKPLPVGVSAYVPNPWDVITLNFTNTWPASSIGHEKFEAKKHI